jgi:hypothetical protein
MLAAVREHFADGLIFLVIDPKNAVYLARRDTVLQIDASGVVLVMDLERALANYLALLGPAGVGSTFGIDQLAQIAGRSRETIDLWLKTGILRPTSPDGKSHGHGRKRRFNVYDGFLAGVAGSLARRNVGNDLIRMALGVLESGEIASLQQVASSGN